MKSEKPHHNLQTLRIYYQHAARHGWLFFVATFGIGMFTVIDICVPFLYKRLVDGAFVDSRSTSAMVGVLALIVGAKLIANVFFRIGHFSHSKASSLTMSELLVTCFKYLQRHSYTFFTNTFPGGLVRKVARFEDAFEDITDQLIWSIIPAFIYLSATTVILAKKNIWLGLGVLIWGVVFIVVNYLFVSYKQKFDRARAEASTEVSAHLADAFSNNTVVKLFTGYGREEVRFTGLTDTLARARKKSWDMDSWSQAIQNILMGTLEFLAFYIAIRLWSQGRFSPGDFVLLQVYLLQVFNYIWGVGRYLHRIFESFANADEMTELLLKPHDVQDRPDAIALVPDDRSITFEHVDFGYGKEKIFADFNLQIKAGERVAFVGSSGSGKSTLIKLLFRYLDLQGGSIKVGDKDIAAVTQDSLRHQIAQVPQDALLFHRSILDNIRYGKPEATTEEVEAAAKAAHCHEFVSKLVHGYDTLVGERGVKLSGGERQRIAIARAILKDAPILVLDEATSSLDSESEHLIQDALHTLMEGRTTIVIAHRLSTIMQMDTIHVLSHGTVIESGSHQALLQREGGAYKRLWDIQAGGFVQDLAQ